MEQVKYQVKVVWMEKDKQITLEIGAGDEKKLFERLKKAISKESKWSLSKLFNQSPIK